MRKITKKDPSAFVTSFRNIPVCEFFELEEQLFLKVDYEQAINLIDGTGMRFAPCQSVIPAKAEISYELCDIHALNKY